MINFLTLEDVNTCKYANQGFYLHILDLSLLPNGEYSDVKIDFCTITKTIDDRQRYFTYNIRIDTDNFTNILYTRDYNGNINEVFSTPDTSINYSDGVLTIVTHALGGEDIAEIGLYMGLIQENTVKPLQFLAIPSVFNLTLKELQNRQRMDYLDIESNEMSGYTYNLLEVGWNNDGNNNYVLANVLKTDFQFNCNQQLTLGKVNTVKLGAFTDYKPNGDLVGGYTPTINIFFENSDTLIPVTFDSTLNDYVFNIDLTQKQNEGKIRFYVNIDANEVINDSLTEVVLDCKFETVNTFSKLQTLFNNGGIGRLGANISLTNDLTAVKSVYLIGNNKTLNMQSHKIKIPSDMTLKAENTVFNNGKNTIQQNTGSNVELTNCTFTNCTGLGSVIDCQVTIGSLSENDDFTTSLSSCIINNCDTAILHGGDLTVTDCTVTGKIGLKEYPYFLYQTDGAAALTSNQFSLTHNGIIDYDIEFNPCIFVCGENALVNGLNHSEWSKNNVMDFLGLQKNRSSIDVTYYYNLIEDYVHLNSSQGYCHTVSDTDYVFKTNITINRGE